MFFSMHLMSAQILKHNLVYYLDKTKTIDP